MSPLSPVMWDKAPVSMNYYPSLLDRYWIITLFSAATKLDVFQVWGAIDSGTPCIIIMAGWAWPSVVGGRAPSTPWPLPPNLGSTPLVWPWSRPRCGVGYPGYLGAAIATIAVATVATTAAATALVALVIAMIVVLVKALTTIASPHTRGHLNHLRKDWHQPRWGLMRRHCEQWCSGPSPWAAAKISPRLTWGKGCYIGKRGN